MVTDSAKTVLFYNNWPNIGHLENPDCIFIRNHGKFLGLISLCEKVRKTQQKHTENTLKTQQKCIGETPWFWRWGGYLVCLVIYLFRDQKQNWKLAVTFGQYWK